MTFSSQLGKAARSGARLTAKMRKALVALAANDPIDFVSNATWKILSKNGLVRYVATDPLAQPALTAMGQLAMAEEAGEYEYALVEMSAREVRKKLRKAGCVEVSQKGSHLKIKCPAGTGIVPVHGSKDIRTGTLHSIEKQTGVDLDGDGDPPPRVEGAMSNISSKLKNLLRDRSGGVKITGPMRKALSDLLKSKPTDDVSDAVWKSLLKNRLVKLTAKGQHTLTAVGQLAVSESGTGFGAQLQDAFEA